MPTIIAGVILIEMFSAEVAEKRTVWKLARLESFVTAFFDITLLVFVVRHQFLPFCCPRG